MNKMVYLAFLALASCIGMALGYGSVMTGHKLTGYPYMTNMGYGYVPYMTGSSGFGGILGGTGSSAGGTGMFGDIIQLFLFIFVINILFSSTGLGSRGLGIGQKSSHAGSDYDYYLK